MTRVGDALMELFARALGLPADYFAPMLTHPTTDLAVNSYPAQPDHDPAAEPPVTFWAHSDSGMLTVLHQRGDYADLQVRDLDDSWITVPVSPDTLVINIGDLMARWTNDRWPSTRHRVVAAPDTTSTRDSIATFDLPNVDTVIALLQPFVRDPLAGFLSPVHHAVGRSGDEVPPAKIGRVRLTAQGQFEVTILPDGDVDGVVAVLRQVPAGVRFLESYGDVDTTLVFQPSPCGGRRDGGRDWRRLRLHQIIDCVPGSPPRPGHGRSGACSAAHAPDSSGPVSPLKPSGRPRRADAWCRYLRAHTLF